MEKVLPDSIEDLSLTTFKMITHHIHVLKEERMKRSLVKKVLTLAVTACMALTSVAAFADDATPAATPVTKKMTIKDSSVTDKSIDGNEYTAYQVMTATAHDNGNGGKVYTYEVTNDFKAFFENGAYGYTLNADNEILVETLDKDGNKIKTTVEGDGEWTNTNSTAAAALAAALEKYANGKTGTVIKAGEFAELPIGFYVVSETKSEQANAVASKPILVNLTEDKDITVKDDSIPLEKVIVEDSKEKKTNSVSIGDKIDYKVTSKVPTYTHVQNLDESKLTYELTDKFSEGITYNKDVKVEIGGTDVTKDVKIDNTADGFKISLTPKQIDDNGGKDVVLTYSGTLNDKAKVNSTEGNPNDITLKYTNNPNETDSFDTKTDEIKTYTFGFDIRKVDKNDIYEDLAGAEFEIKDSEGNPIAVIEYDEEGKPVVKSGKATTDKNGRITVSGVEGSVEGTSYTIEETKAPEGYSLLGNGITVTIKAEAEKDDQGNVVNDSKGNPVLTGKATFEVTGGTATAYEKEEGKSEDNRDDKVREGDKDSPTSVETDGNGSIDVVALIKDTKGISLPETGSRSALFCMIGGAFIVLLGALYYEFAVRRKKA